MKSFEQRWHKETRFARFLAICVLFIVAGCGEGNNTRHPNFVVFLADDLGLDWAPCYGDLVSMPNLRALCETGLTFDTVWANPSCTASRASILTGRYTMRHRAGAVRNEPGIETRRLRHREVIIPEALSRIQGANYTNAAIGKWHLADRLNGGTRSAVTSAFQHYVGTSSFNYFEYPKNVDGAIVGSETKYKTTAIVDDAIEWI